MGKTRAAIGSSVFFALAPGVAAGLIPYLLTGWDARHPSHWAPLRGFGWLVLALSVGFLVHAFSRFALEGIGTPAPVAPTERLVVGGVYRHVRNPMYLAVSGAIVGQALVLARPGLLLYAAAIAAVFVAFVYLYEQPALRRQFGESYEEYRRAVPGWWPRLRAWAPPGETSDD